MRQAGRVLDREGYLNFMQNELGIDIMKSRKERQELGLR